MDGGFGLAAGALSLSYQGRAKRACGPASPSGRKCPSLGMEGRELVPTVRAKRQGIDLRDRRRIEIAIEMRKQSAATRGLPFQFVAKRGCIHAQQHEIALSGEMFRRGLRRLFGAGEMNEAVLAIDRRTAEYASALGFTPER
jgi:hypothetical protein